MSRRIIDQIAENVETHLGTFTDSIGFRWDATVGAVQVDGGRPPMPGVQLIFTAKSLVVGQLLTLVTNMLPLELVLDVDQVGHLVSSAFEQLAAARQQTGQLVTP